MSGPPPRPPHPPAAIAASLAWRAPSWFHDEQHNVPPPPGVSPAPATFHQANSFPWTPAPGSTNAMPTTHSAGLGAVLNRQYVPMQATLMNTNETPQVWANIDNSGGVYWQQHSLPSQFPPSNADGALIFGHIVHHSGHESPNFPNPLACKEIAPHFASHMPSTQIPQQPSHSESRLLHKNDASNPANPDKVDVNDLIPNLRALISQANDSISKILTMMKMNSDALPVKGLDPLANGSTGRNFANLGEVEGCKDHLSASHNIRTSDDSATASTIFNNIFESLAKSGQNLFYKDAPGVVQIPVAASGVNFKDSKLPDFAVGERWDDLTPQCFEADRQAQETLLPSQFWRITSEISEWKDLPTKLLPYQLKAMAGLGRIQHAELRKWLLSHSILHGVTFSGCMVDHIVVLVVFCLRAVHREATAYVCFSDVNKQVDCRALPQSASWLATQLSSICDSAHSRDLVLNLYKYAMKISALYSTRCAWRSSHKALQEKESITVDLKKTTGASLEKEFCDSGCALLQACANHTCLSSRVGDRVLCLEHVAAAILAIEAEAVHLTCQASGFSAASSDQRSASHSMLTKKAAEIRATRVDYKAVLDHDGLMWQRPQNHESKRNMTKEELLAEERDYKRRRMSYRGKKVQRTPVEVLRDIIEGHMEDIVATGGIGCIGRRPQDVHLRELETFPSALGSKDDTIFCDTSSSRDASSREARASYHNDERYLRSESRKSFRTEKVERYRLGSHGASSRSSDRNSQGNSDRKYQSTEDHGGWDDKFHGDKHGSSKYYSRTCDYESPQGLNAWSSS